MEGDDHGEAYTASMRGVGVSHVIDKIAGAETFSSAGVGDGLLSHIRALIAWRPSVGEGAAGVKPLRHEGARASVRA